jgi:hypothetical protein
MLSDATIGVNQWPRSQAVLTCSTGPSVDSKVQRPRCWPGPGSPSPVGRARRARPGAGCAMAYRWMTPRRSSTPPDILTCTDSSSSKGMDSRPMGNLGPLDPLKRVCWPHDGTDGATEASQSVDLHTGRRPRHVAPDRSPCPAPESIIHTASPPPVTDPQSLGHQSPLTAAASNPRRSGAAHQHPRTMPRWIQA